MTIRLVLFIVAIYAMFSASAEAEDRPKPSRIGMLLPGSEASSGYLKGLYQGLVEQGLIEGKNISLERRYANGRIDQLPALAAELAASGVNLIFTSGDQAAKAAKQATDRIPIIAVTCDALAAGLVSNLSRPGGNLTGVTCINADLDGKRVELIKEILPSISRLVVMLNPDDQRSVAEFKQIELAAKASSIELLRQSVLKPEEIVPAFSQAASAGATGAIVIYDPMFFLRRRELNEIAVSKGIATVFNFREFVEAGGLMSYGPNVQDMCRQSARLIKKALSSESAGETPMEQPTRFELVINLGTAKKIGLVVPSALIGRADEVIE
ncbi:ABC transporter substrate-binding protein [Bradyrhizobium diazoefficiens]|uniref:ABC transporter substrate-binding protein n=1 Tax=Bradyrhizobium diazoefficiens TaxID=1355477 RepID=UPI0019093EBE|nr:ABC transporter substrate-binding protein [Bradyrhizobium diazoefficiens]MBK3660408.1 ABC transporter substrate-binding protein [Bradyrhizobium diazoefficiens]